MDEPKNLPKFRPDGMPQKPLKWATPEKRREMCELLCQHLEIGLSYQSWEHAAQKTILRYIENFPDDFCPEKIDAAHRRGLAYLEKMGVSGASGQIKGFNPLAWKFIMQNKAGWADKAEVKNEHAFVPIQINLPPVTIENED